MSGPSVLTVSPSSTTSSTISTARSTPKQNPYSSASKTSIGTLNRRSGGGGGWPLAPFPPLFSQPVAPGNAVVDPLHFPLQRGRKFSEHSLLEVGECMRHVFWQDCV